MLPNGIDPNKYTTRTITEYDMLNPNEEDTYMSKLVVTVHDLVINQNVGLNIPILTVSDSSGTKSYTLTDNDQKQLQYTGNIFTNGNLIDIYALTLKIGSPLEKKNYFLWAQNHV